MYLSKSHFAHVHGTHDILFKAEDVLLNHFKREPDLTRDVKTFFDVRCRLCQRLFSNSQKRDAHESRVCYTKAVLLCDFYGTPLPLVSPLTNDYTNQTTEAMEHQFLVAQATSLMRKHSDDESLIDKDDTIEGEYSDKTDKAKTLAQYLVNKTLDLVRKTKTKTQTKTQDEPHQESSRPSTSGRTGIPSPKPSISKATRNPSPAPSQETTTNQRPKARKKAKTCEFIEDEAVESDDLATRDSEEHDHESDHLTEMFGASEPSDSDTKQETKRSKQTPLRRQQKSTKINSSSGSDSDSDALNSPEAKALVNKLLARQAKKNEKKANKGKKTKTTTVSGEPQPKNRKKHSISEEEDTEPAVEDDQRHLVKKMSSKKTSK